MTTTTAIVVGAGVGLLAGIIIGGMLSNPSDYCVRVAAGVRAEVGDQLGPGAVAFGDATGLWKYTPGLLSLFGVEP